MHQQLNYAYQAYVAIENHTQIENFTIKLILVILLLDGEEGVSNIVYFHYKLGSQQVNSLSS